MIRELFDYYLEHQQELVEKYNGKYLVISKGSIVPFDSENSAYYYGKSKIGLGNFIVQLCTPGEEAYTQQFFSPILSF